MSEKLCIRVFTRTIEKKFILNIYNLSDKYQIDSNSDTKQIQTRRSDKKTVWFWPRLFLLKNKSLLKWLHLFWSSCEAAHILRMNVWTWYNLPNDLLSGLCTPSTLQGHALLKNQIYHLYIERPLSHIDSWIFRNNIEQCGQKSVLKALTTFL